MTKMSLLKKVGKYRKAVSILESNDAKEAEYYIIDFGYISDLGSVGPSDNITVNCTIHKDGKAIPGTMNSYFNSVQSVVDFENTINLDDLHHAVEEYRARFN